jgi:hypothetical protein
MKRKSKHDALLQRLHDLQWDLYKFQEQLQDKKHHKIAELIGESALELDFSQNKLQMAIELINQIKL